MFVLHFLVFLANDLLDLSNEWSMKCDEAKKREKFSSFVWVQMYVNKLFSKGFIIVGIH